MPEEGGLYTWPKRRDLLFSSPEQCSQRAVVLPQRWSLALALVLALASTSTDVLSFALKFLRPHYFQIF